MRNLKPHDTLGKITKKLYYKPVKNNHKTTRKKHDFDNTPKTLDF